MDECIPEQANDDVISTERKPIQLVPTREIPNQAYRNDYSWLFHHDVYMTEAIGRPLAEQGEPNLEMIYDVLDLGCRAGGWVFQVANAYPEMTVTGIDSSPSAIGYANTFALIQHLPNVRFGCADVTRPLPFPDQSFHLVNARFIISRLLHTEQWPLLLKECIRVLRPGGIIRLTEGEWRMATASAPAVARLFRFGLDPLSQLEESVSRDGHDRTITPQLLQSIRGAGFQEVQCKAYALDYSYGSACYPHFVENYTKSLPLWHPFLFQQETATSEELDTLSQQALQEMQSSNFGALLSLLTVWGKWPES